jgi:hypothetical protein
MRLKHLGYAVMIASAAIALAIGSATSGQAKAMKKVTAPPPPYLCNWLYKPVCGVKDGIKLTYSSACWAAKDGAKILYEGACKAKKAKKKPAMKKKSKKKM